LQAQHISQSSNATWALTSTSSAVFPDKVLTYNSTYCFRLSRRSSKYCQVHFRFRSCISLRIAFVANFQRALAGDSENSLSGGRYRWYCGKCALAMFERSEAAPVSSPCVSGCRNGISLASTTHLDTGRHRARNQFHRRRLERPSWRPLSIISSSW
jgi:hypothetical protein